MIDQLEPRRLLSLMVSVDKGVLVVQGDEDANVIMVDQSGSGLSVTIDDSTFTTSLRKVKSIKVLGMEGNDLITLTPNVMLAARVYGGVGNDTLVGSDHPCTLSGDAGNDVLRGGMGRDVLSGGVGVDIADYSQRTDALAVSLDGKANDGAKPVVGVTPEGDNVSNDCEIIKGGSDDDRIVGNALSNTLIEGAGNDSLYGLAGNDVLSGGRGDDALYGGDGDDVLVAVDLSSADTLDGGNGSDAYTIDEVQSQQDTVLNCEVELAVITT